MNRLLTLAALLLLAACSGGGTQAPTSSADSSDIAVGTDSGFNAELATVIWEGAGIYASFSPKLDQWQTRLTAGEVVQVLDQTEAELDGKKTPLLKVKQPDTGKEGWLNANFAIRASKAAAVIEPIALHSRPALTAEEKKQFAAFDIVAVTAEKEDWVRVTGKRSDATWMDADKWIKARALSYDRKDLDVAVLVQRATKLKSKEEKMAELNSIRSNPDLRGSSFDTKLEALLNELVGGDELGGEAVPDTMKAPGGN